MMVKGRPNGGAKPPPCCATRHRARSATTSHARPTAAATDNEITRRAICLNATRALTGGAVGGRLQRPGGPPTSEKDADFQYAATVLSPLVIRPPSDSRS